VNEEFYRKAQRSARREESVDTGIKLWSRLLAVREIQLAF
jgi:hypothetical protein